MRQDDDPACDGRPGAADLRRHPHRPDARQRPAAGGARHRHGLPVLRALPAPQDPRQPRLPAPSRGQAREGGQGTRRRGRPDDAARTIARPQAAAPLGRRAAARCPGPRPRPPAAGLLDGRAADEPRRGAACGRAHRDQAPAGRARDDDGLRHPRPGGGHVARAPHRDPQQGPRRAGRHAPRGLRPPGEPVLRRLHRLAADEPHRGAGGRGRAPRARGARAHAAGRSAARPVARRRRTAGGARGDRTRRRPHRAGPGRLGRGVGRRDHLRRRPRGRDRCTGPDATDRALRGRRAGRTAPCWRDSAGLRHEHGRAGGLMGTVAAHGLRKSFGDVQALDGVDLDVPDGSFFVVLGPSGAGKTTTLRAIAGLEKLDGGSVHLDGRDATADTPAARDLAMVFQSYALYPRRTAYDNIASPLRARKASSSDIAAAVQQVSALLHIERLLQRRPAQMSGGEMQRVALARALVRRPRAFLMDEPLTNLDLKLRVEMRTELTRIHRTLGGTFLYVTNDQVEALSMAVQLGVRRDGRVQQVGTPTELYERPANQWVAGFVGSPRISLLACRAEGDRLVGAEGWSLPRPRWTTAEDGRPLLLGLRAEDVSVEKRGEAALTGELYALEPLGDRTVVDVRVGSETVKVKARPSVTGTPGQRVSVTVDLDRAHIFDADTGLALSTSGR